MIVANAPYCARRLVDRRLGRASSGGSGGSGGLVGALLGIGGGIVHVPVLSTVLGFPVHTATATSHFILAIVTIRRAVGVSRILPFVLLAAIMLGIYGFHLPLWVLIVAALINGIALQAGTLAWTHLLQEKIPNEQLGRVSSIDQLGSTCLMPVGLYLAGIATHIIGPSPVFLIGGGLTALAGLLALTHPAIRNLD